MNRELAEAMQNVDEFDQLMKDKHEALKKLNKYKKFFELQDFEELNRALCGINIVRMKNVISMISQIK